MRCVAQGVTGETGPVRGDGNVHPQPAGGGEMDAAGQGLYAVFLPRIVPLQRGRVCGCPSQRQERLAAVKGDVQFPPSPSVRAQRAVASSVAGDITGLP